MLKKYVLYFLTSITSAWIINSVLSGIIIANQATLFLVALLITAAIWLTEYVYSQLKKKNLLIFLLMGTLIGFFVIYIGTLLFDGFAFTGGSLAPLDLAILETPSIRSVDSVLTLLLASFIFTIIAFVTKWASTGEGKKKESSKE
ncbi:hypothetical protein JW962_01250 [Candidatus Dojkabacteria bacterium]|nr:hypothetical protein [Candidatus Dojkabacteria bacterium]